jgi:palmitoyltransferase ZDHHC13/17
MISKSFNSHSKQIANFCSHCPWINNCVGNNNLRHFLLYLLFMEVGVIIFVRLVLVCETAISQPLLYHLYLHRQPQFKLTSLVHRY